MSDQRNGGVLHFPRPESEAGSYREMVAEVVATQVTLLAKERLLEMKKQELQIEEELAAINRRLSELR